MFYKIKKNKLEVYVTNIDVDNGVDLHNPYDAFPKEAKDWYNLHKDNMKETKEFGRTQRSDGSVIDGYEYKFEMIIKK